MVLQTKITYLLLALVLYKRIIKKQRMLIDNNLLHSFILL